MAGTLCPSARTSRLALVTAGKLASAITSSSPCPIWAIRYKSSGERMLGMRFNNGVFPRSRSSSRPDGTTRSAAWRSDWRCTSWSRQPRGAECFARGSHDAALRITCRRAKGTRPARKLRWPMIGGFAEANPDPFKVTLSCLFTYERMEFQDRCPVPRGRGVAERPPDGLGRAAFEDAARAPHVGDTAADGQGIRSPILLEQRLELGSICRIAQDSDEQARGIVGNPEQGVLDNDAGKLRGRQQRNSSGDSELRRQGLFDA